MLMKKDLMQHRRSQGFRIGRKVLGFWSFVTLIGVSLLAATARAQNYPPHTYPTTPNYSAPNTYRPSQRHIVRGAGRGAALGAIGGAIAGDAGKGAAAGAAMGGTVGVFRRRDERRRQAQGGYQ
jgi:Glycine-zipper domain